MSYLCEAVSDYDKVPGDSSGREVRVCGYWSYSTLDHTTMYCYRHPDEDFRNDLMEAAVAIADNDNIGYEMSEQRVTSYNAFGEIGWDIDRIKDVGICSIDCSEMMGCCVNFASGSAVMGSDTWTGNIGSRLMSLGLERLPWDVDFIAGDILVVHHDSQGTGHTGMFIGNDPRGEMYMSNVWDEDLWGTPAKQLLYWSHAHAKAANEKCDQILEELKNIKVEGGVVDYDRILSGVEEIQGKLKLVAE